MSTRVCLLLLFLLSLLGAPSYGATIQDHREWLGDTQPQSIKSGCAPGVPSSSLTLDAFACRGYVLDSNGLWQGIAQAAAAVGPLDEGNGDYFVALHTSTATAVGGWTRQFGTHYLWQQSTVQPPDPAGGVVFAHVTVAGGAITAVTLTELAGNQISLQPPQARAEQMLGAGFAPYVYSGCQPAVPSLSLTIDAFTCLAFVHTTDTPPRLIPAVQSLAAITVPDSAVVWLAIHQDTTSTPSGCGGGNWVRVTDTRYLTCANAGRPDDPSSGIAFARVTVAGSVVTAVTSMAYRSPIDASLGSHAVESWGANGFDSTDDSTEIINAIDAAELLRGGRVRFGPGVFLLSTPIILDSSDTSLILEGCGFSEGGTTNACTVLKWTGGAEIMITVRVDARNVTIKDMDFENTGTVTDFVLVDFTDMFLLQNVNMRVSVSPSNSFVSLGLEDELRVESMYFDHVTMRAAGLGGDVVCLRATRVQDFFATRFNVVFCQTIIGFAGSLDTVSFVCNGCSFNSGANEDVIRIHNAHSIAFHGGHIETDGTGYGINVLSSTLDQQSIAFYGTYFVGRGHGNDTPYAIHMNDSESEIAMYDTWIGQMDIASPWYLVRNTASSRVTLINTQLNTEESTTGNLITSTTTGSVTLIGNMRGTTVLADHLHFKETKTAEISQPDLQQPIDRYWNLQRIESDEYPSGVAITDITISTSAACTSPVALVSRTNNGTAWAVAATVESITLSGTETEDDGTIDNATLVAGDYLSLDLGAGAPCNVGTMSVHWKYTRN